MNMSLSKRSVNQQYLPGLLSSDLGDRVPGRRLTLTGIQLLSDGALTPQVRDVPTPKEETMPTKFTCSDFNPSHIGCITPIHWQ